MNFELYCAGASRDEQTAMRSGGCGVVLVAYDDHGRVQCREFGYGLGCSGPDLSEVQAARLALASVAPAYRNSSTVLYTMSPIVASLLSTDQSPPETLARAVVELRRWYSYYHDISVVLVAEPSGHLIRAMELAGRSMESQESTDSLTFQLEATANEKR